jgi:hypothetical protein
MLHRLEKAFDQIDRIKLRQMLENSIYPNDAGTQSTKIIQNVNNELIEEILSNVGVVISQYL